MSMLLMQVFISLLTYYYAEAGGVVWSFLCVCHYESRTTVTNAETDVDQTW